MDEPSEGLAPLFVKEVGNIVSQLRDEDLSILLVEQNVPLALRVSDAVYVMLHGRIAYSGSSRELALNDQIQSEYIGVAKRKTHRQ